MKENVTIPIRASFIVTHLRSQLTKSLGTDSHYSDGPRALNFTSDSSPCSDETGAGQDNAPVDKREYAFLADCGLTVSH